jgi:PadR family transcriptional regulator, regulatory protein PadR
MTGLWPVNPDPQNSPPIHPFPSPLTPPPNLFPYSAVCIPRTLSMPKPDSLQGSLDLLVLKILSRRPRLHGYAIMTAIQEISREVLRVEEGSLYPALHRMEEAGWIRAEWIVKDTGRRARIYELTPEGKKQLGAEESRWQAVTAAVNRVLRTA